MPYSIKQVSELTGLTPRALRHYDRIGLLKPAGINAAGYRQYSARDLDRIHQILVLKELDFSLPEIRRLLSSDRFDRRRALRLQQDLLRVKKERLEDIIASVGKRLGALSGGNVMRPEDMFSAFAMSEIEAHQRQYAQETKEKWGATDAYQESARRAARYTSRDWARIKQDSGAVFAKLATLMHRPPEDPEVLQAVADWRKLISTYFYECTLDIFQGLSDLYVQDQRFTKNIDRIKPGLADFLSRAIRVYCQQAGRTGDANGGR